MAIICFINTNRIPIGLHYFPDWTDSISLLTVRRIAMKVHFSDEAGFGDFMKMVLVQPAAMSSSNLEDIYFIAQHTHL